MEVGQTAVQGAAGMEAREAIALEARNVYKSLPLGRERLDIIKGVSFQVKKGEFVALMGPSGSGKSTLLGLIAGLDTPTAGQVFIDGLDITHMSEGQLARVRNQKIGMVFQAFNLIPTLTALENVEVPLYVGRHPDSARARAREVLTMVGLGERLKHRPHQLSGGEQQRVAIARALATRPTIVIGDEPTGNLDARTSATILDLIAELRQTTQTTFVIATHDQAVAARADRIIRILDGRLESER
jgi:putative ABC transport system ATP-binding protein